MAELNAIVVKCALSLYELLAEPSAIFEQIETDALLNCEINPNFSESGNVEVKK